NVERVAFEGRAITTLSHLQFAVLKIDVPQLRMMMGFIEMMNLRLKLLNAPTVMRARQFKSARGGRRSSIDGEVVEQRRKTKSDKNEQSPNPFPPPNRVNEHP